MTTEIDKPKIKVALADDHVLLRLALANLIDGFETCKVVIQVNNGRELIRLVNDGIVPDIILLDLNMPEMDGFETAIWFKNHCPSSHVLMLTMYDSELSMVRLLQAGVKGFLKKDIHPFELRYAIESVLRSGFYYSHQTDKLVNLFRQQPGGSNPFEKTLLSESEIQFLQLTSTELTYKEIAQQLHLSPRAVDNMRDNLFEKLGVKSRVGLVIYAIKHGLVTF